MLPLWNGFSAWYTIFSHLASERDLSRRYPAAGYGDSPRKKVFSVLSVDQCCIVCGKRSSYKALAVTSTKSEFSSSDL